jgi:hypothetical protein
MTVAQLAMTVFAFIRKPPNQADVRRADPRTSLLGDLNKPSNYHYG